MKIPWDAEATLLSRPNRFVGVVDIEMPPVSSVSPCCSIPSSSSTSSTLSLSSSSDLHEVKAHIHDPGRLEDLLYPGNKLLLRKATNPNRKTGWDVIAAKADDGWILINSSFHRAIAEWAIRNKVCSFFEDVREIRPEQRFGESRLDFLLKKDNIDQWVEVKGCTLIYGKNATFPDAPTIRGRRHVGELKKAFESGCEATIVVLIFRKDGSCFKANSHIDPDFAKAFEDAVATGVNVCPLVFSFEGEDLFYKGTLPLCIKE